MMQSRTKGIAGSVSIFLIALPLLVVGYGIQAEAKKAKAGIPAEQVIAAIRTAIAAKPGNVLGVEAENEGGKTVCEVEILSPDGKTYEVKVDVANNAVLEVDLEGDDDEDKDHKDEKIDKDKRPDVTWRFRSYPHLSSIFDPAQTDHDHGARFCL